MKVIDPDPLTREAATILNPVMDDVVVIGATAVRIMLHGSEALVTPTRDVDTAAENAEAIERVIKHLEGPAGMTRSELPHERSFTWVAGDLKVQVVRAFFPFARPPADGLPTNTMVGEVLKHREQVAFVDTPTVQRLWVAGPAALVGLKREAFGRTRPDGQSVDRDYGDVVLLLDHCLSQIVERCAHDFIMRRRVRAAATTIRDEEIPRTGAIRELVANGTYDDEARAETQILRVVERTLRRLAP